jgi:hypothetical protein
MPATTPLIIFLHYFPARPLTMSFSLLAYKQNYGFKPSSLLVVIPFPPHRTKNFQNPYPADREWKYGLIQDYRSRKRGAAL